MIFRERTLAAAVIALRWAWACSDSDSPSSCSFLSAQLYLSFLCSSKCVARIFKNLVNNFLYSSGNLISHGIPKGKLTTKTIWKK
jgi:hypothetical protein